MSHWRRDDVEPGQLWLSPSGEVFRVIGIADDPTVSLEPFDAIAVMDGHELRRAHIVIHSPLFAEWKRLDPTEPR